MTISKHTEETYWLHIKLQGKRRFRFRTTLGSIFVWLIVLPVAELFRHQEHAFSAQFFVIWLVLLPIFLFEGYLRAGWLWKDFEKKFPQDTYHP